MTIPFTLFIMGHDKGASSIYGRGGVNLNVPPLHPWKLIWLVTQFCKGLNPLKHDKRCFWALVGKTFVRCDAKKSRAPLQDGENFPWSQATGKKCPAPTPDQQSKKCCPLLQKFWPSTPTTPDCKVWTLQYLNALPMKLATFVYTFVQYTCYYAVPCLINNEAFLNFISVNY